MPASAALLTALSGLALGLSLIVAIGSQNAFVLRQGSSASTSFWWWRCARYPTPF